MPRGPRGERRPADVNARAVMVGKIATGEIKDVTTDDGKNAAAVALGLRSSAPDDGKQLRRKRPPHVGNRPNSQSLCISAGMRVIARAMRQASSLDNLFKMPCRIDSSSK
jgi:hypothetical protein